MGVWIETVKLLDELDNYKVTPYVGVWIETVKISEPEGLARVTPYVGVWIETNGALVITVGLKGHSLCGSVD